MRYVRRRHHRLLIISFILILPIFLTTTFPSLLIQKVLKIYRNWNNLNFHKVELNQDSKPGSHSIPTKPNILMNGTHSKWKLILNDYGMNENIRTKFSNPLPCNSNTFLLQLVTSHVGNVELRQRFRSEFNLSQPTLRHVHRVFLLGQIPMTQNETKFRIPTIKEIEIEARENQDVIIGPFIENYRNLTLKHVMGLKWASVHCQMTSFILKQDDDIYVDIYGVLAILEQKFPSWIGYELRTNRKQDWIYGRILQNPSVIRSPISKWFVRLEEYSNPTYPSFVSGWAYLTTSKTIETLLKKMMDFSYFWIDDVFITGILREAADVSLIDGSKAFALRREYFECCLTKNVIRFHQIPPNGLWCDFLFGPSPKDSIRFKLQRQSRKCYETRSCFWRSSILPPNSKSLFESCVLESSNDREMSLKIGHKGIPFWKPIKLNFPITS